MTHLDPIHARQREGVGSWMLRLIALLAVVIFGWFALTVGTEADGRPQIVQEPMTRSF